MERLTENVNGVITYVGPGCRYETGEIPAEVGVAGVRALLASVNAYETTGLTPEEITANMAKLAAYEKAERDGLLLRLPCKVGDKVKVDARTWGNTWNFVTIERGEFLVGEIVSVTKTKKQVLMKIRVEHNVPWRRVCKRYPVSALGKTVFSTRAEAEAALKEATPCT